MPKKCLKCKLEGEFGKDAKRPDGLQAWCKNCFADYAKKRNGRPEIKALQTQRYSSEKYKESEKKRRKTVSYKAAKKRYDVGKGHLPHSLRNRLNQALKKGFKNGSAVQDLGCSIDFFRVYLESKFQVGMTWDNYGREGWHIDHVVALANFNLDDKQQFLKAVHYTNLQPLWAKANLMKGTR
jgi:hypothetical protein